MSPAKSRSIIRRTLRVLFVSISCLLVIAAILAIIAWRKSSTPLTRLEPLSAHDVDLAAFERGELQFPGRSWVPVDPRAFGWDSDALDRAHRFTRSLDTSSLMILHRGVPIAMWGDVDRRENSQSMRKSLLSGLVGLLAADRRLDLDARLEALGIDDDPPLTAEEKTATVRDLMLSRSGIYHSAIYEAGWWKRNKPERSTAAPGVEWYYNNWGFNALSTIYESAAGATIGQDFSTYLAGPTGMEDFRPDDVIYLSRDHLTEKIQGNESDHPAYLFMISARDLARFGLLYLADGLWENHRVLPAGWVRESTIGAAMRSTWGERSYGYMWWVDPPRDALPYPSFATSGGRGHKMTIVPALDLVIVHRIPTGGPGFAAQIFRRFIWHPAVEDRDYETLLELILEAYPDLPPIVPELNPVAEGPDSSIPPPSAGGDADRQQAPPRSSS